MGLKNDDRYQAAYWKAFEEFFGVHNAPVVKAMLLARKDKVDTGDQEIDRVCFGLRQTMSWLAEAIERRAIASLGKAGPPETSARRRPRKGTTST